MLPLLLAACEGTTSTSLARAQRLARDGVCLVQIRSEQIEIVRLDGSRGRQRLQSVGASNWPLSARVSPDGLFAVGPAGGNLIAVALRGGELWRIEGASASNGIAIAADARKIAFTTSGGRLAIYDVTTKSQRQLDVSGRNPSWAPSGDRLAYDDGTRVHVYDLSHGAHREIGGGTEPSWAPDGTSLGVRVRSDRIDLVNIETRERRALVEASGHLSVPRWSPQGELMMYTRQGPRHWWSKAQWTGSEPSQIVVRDTESGAEAFVGEFYKADPGDYSWVTNRDLCHAGAQ